MTIQRGFTLIELLFGIAVLGLLSTSGILFYQQRMQEQKIQKTVAQILQWQQAGMAYYVKTKAWPQSTDVLINGGYMPPDAASTNPWCPTRPGLICYTVTSSPEKPQLFAVTAEHLPPAPTDEGGIPGAIAARLAYANPVKAQDARVTGVINIPLEGLTMNPDLIVVDLVPFVSQGLNMTFESTGTGIATLWKAEGILPNKKAFACDKLYGKAYSFMPYVIISDYKTKNYYNPPQHPIFSFIEMRAETNSENEIVLTALLRPQGYGLNRVVWGDLPVPPYYTISSIVSPKDVIEIQGQVSFVCCKKGISCFAQPRM